MDSIDRAVRELQRGRLLVYPTDTLYGLGARVLDARAVQRVSELKGRPATAPLSFALSSYEEVERYARLGPAQRASIRRLLPGAFTLLLPASAWARSHLPPEALGPGPSVGIRIPAHPLARELARRAGPITSTSVNRHGAPAARSLSEAAAMFGPGRFTGVDGPPAPSGRPSTLVDFRHQGVAARLRIR